MNPTVLTFIIVLGIVIVVRGYSTYARRRELRRRGMDYRDGWRGYADAFWQSGGGGGGDGGGGGGHRG